MPRLSTITLKRASVSPNSRPTLTVRRSPGPIGSSCVDAAPVSGMRVSAHLARRRRRVADEHVGLLAGLAAVPAFGHRPRHRGRRVAGRGVALVPWPVRPPHRALAEDRLRRGHREPDRASGQRRQRRIRRRLAVEVHRPSSFGRHLVRFRGGRAVAQVIGHRRGRRRRPRIQQREEGMEEGPGRPFAEVPLRRQLRRPRRGRPAAERAAGIHVHRPFGKDRRVRGDNRAHGRHGQRGVLAVDEDRRPALRRERARRRQRRPAFGEIPHGHRGGGRPRVLEQVVEEERAGRAFGEVPGRRRRRRAAVERGADPARAPGHRSIRGHRHIGFDDDGHGGRHAEHGVDGHRLPLARRQRELMRDDAPALAQQGERDVRRLGRAQVEHRHRRLEEARGSFGEIAHVPAHGMPPRGKLLRVREAIVIGIASGVARVVRIEPEERLPRVRHRVAVGVRLLGCRRMQERGR